MAKETWSYSHGKDFSFCIQHGSVEIQTRQIPHDGGIAYQGRSIRKNKYGEVTEITPWETTVVLRS